MVAVELVGDKEVLAVLRDMQDGAQRAVMRPAILAGCRIIAKEAKKRAPGDKLHRIRRLISVRVWTNKRTKNVVGQIYVKPSKSQTVIIAGESRPWSAVANILEFGRQRHPGIIPAMKFMRGARAAKGPEALRKVRKVADGRITAEWEKASRRHKAVWR